MILLLLLLFFFVLFYRYKKEGYSLLLNATTWFIIYYVFYFIIPCLFINKINTSMKWNFNFFTIKETELIIFILGLLLICFYCNTKIVKYDNINFGIIRSDVIYTLAKLFIFIASIIILIAIYKMLRLFSTNTYLKSYILLRENGQLIEKQFGLKKITYILFPFCFYLYSKDKKKIVFFPLVLLVVFDFISGKRTNSFLCIFFLYMVFILVNRKTYFKIIVPVFILLLGATMFIRTASLSVTGKITWEDYIMSFFGEFTNSFVTLPYIIQNNMEGNGLSITSLGEYLFSGLLSGSIRELLFNVTLGQQLSDIIGRGYGLAFNIITESIYLFGYFGLLCIFIYYVLYLLIDKIFSGSVNFVIKVLFILNLRLLFREGFTYFSITIYIFFFYVALPYFSGKNNNQLKFLIK